ncbi:hypothetical protein D3C87_1627590 [compost metagenome]
MRIHPGRAARGGAYGRMIHADDLALDLDQQFAERHVAAMAELHFQIGEARVGAQVPQEGVDTLGRAGQEQIDALFGQQDGPFERGGAGLSQQQDAQLGQGIQRNEFISGDIDDGSHGKAMGSGRRSP